MEEHLPDYEGGSILNLINSILIAFNNKPRYSGLKTKKMDLTKMLRKSKNIVLIVVDGMGYYYLSEYGRGSTIHKNTKDRITSIFPSDTAPCLTTFFTALAPQQHAISGWYMYLKEHRVLAAIVPFALKNNRKVPLTRLDIAPKNIFDQKTVFEKITASSYVIVPRKILRSDYTSTQAAKAKKIGYDTLPAFFDKIKKILHCGDKRKFVYGYIDCFDSLCHKYGTRSKQAHDYFWAFDKQLNLFLKSTDLRDTAIIITADHGAIDTTKPKTIRLGKHQKLVKMLALPLCGNPRVAYCYVQRAKIKQFRYYVKKYLNYCCRLYDSRMLIRRHYFGLFKPNRRLRKRIGTFCLVMKENYIIKDSVQPKISKPQIGVHGGLSKEEMYVPLAIIKG